MSDPNIMRPLATIKGDLALLETRLQCVLNSLEDTSTPHKDDIIEFLKGSRTSIQFVSFRLHKVRELLGYI